MMFSKILKIILFIALLSSCQEEVNEKTIKIQIFTSALGKEGDTFPQDIIDLWEAFNLGDSEIAPIIKLVRIDLENEAPLGELYVPTSSTHVQQSAILEKEAEELESKKIDTIFSISQPSNLQTANKRIAEHPPENIFYFKSSIVGKENFEKPAELLKVLEQKINQNSETNQEYIIVYNLLDRSKADKEAADKAKAEADKVAADKLTADKIKADAIKADKEVADKANAKSKADAELKIKQEAADAKAKVAAELKAKQEKYKADTTIPITPIENTTTSAVEEVRPEPKSDIKLYSLIVNTEPRSTNIKISGRKYYSGTKLAEGKYQIRVSKKGYFSQSITVNLTKNKAVSINLKAVSINLVEKPVSQKPPENSSDSSDSGSPQRPVEQASSSCSQQLNKIRSYVGKDIKAANDGLILLSIFDVRHAAKCTASDRVVSDGLREQLQQQKN